VRLIRDMDELDYYTSLGKFGVKGCISQNTSVINELQKDDENGRSLL